MEEVQHPDNLKDKEEQMLRQNCWYVVLLQGDARNGEANKLLMLPPFKYTADKRTPEDVQIRRRMDENKANEIMVAGLPPDQRAILQEHADPFDRWKALQSFFYVIGDRKTAAQFQDKLTKSLLYTKKKTMDEYLSGVHGAAKSLRHVRGRAEPLDNDLVGMVVDALPDKFYKAQNRLEIMLDNPATSVSWSATRVILIGAERELSAKTGTRQSSDDSDEEDEQKSTPSAQATEGLAGEIAAAMVSGFQQMSVQHSGGGGRGGGGGWRNRGRGGKGGGRRCFCCGAADHLARDCPQGYRAKNGGF